MTKSRALETVTVPLTLPSAAVVSVSLTVGTGAAASVLRVSAPVMCRLPASR